jgi:hypothetical protein
MHDPEAEILGSRSREREMRLKSRDRLRRIRRLTLVEEARVELSRQIRKVEGIARPVDSRQSFEELFP